jgi:hypothetical protein
MKPVVEKEGKEEMITVAETAGMTAEAAVVVAATAEAAAAEGETN